jgi:hypothetical protein
MANFADKQTPPDENFNQRTKSRINARSDKGVERCQTAQPSLLRIQ